MNRIVFLGTKGGPAIRAGGAMPTSSLLELDGRRVVVDCGIGVTKALVEAGMDLKALDLIFITHLHSDHILELGPLIHTAWTTGMQGPVRVFGPKGTEAYWQGFMASMAYDNAIRVADEGRRPLEEIVSISTYDEGVVLSDTLAVSALRVPHPPLEDCFALRFEGSKTVTFSGDTAYFPPLAAFAQGSDVLVHEALLPEGVELIIQRTGLGDRLRDHLYNSHTKAADVGRIAGAAGVGRLVLNHLVPADDASIGPQDWLAQVALTWNGKAEVGSDGMEILL
ncbi:MBL fold metallo-hydrolase [Pseudorhodobacter sp. E13]|uniref:MBL fold metallo-hydrolase n=1 Tax=Pseudorhodobacter sp. E13 TaxID=2487931 RepID=UPI000F8F4250|nr:MBL fold metallo-hydrolase [Pseudorhodobacter sp. E13]RUS61012.1 MBL fold metallo-hydrolase [Pseudorhodobacter sp. E13]